MEGLIGQFNDFSYTLPVVNVTITKTVALEYARTHAANGGPVFALVLLLLFGIIMTLIWLYLLLSACCCCCIHTRTKKKRGTTQGSPRISPRVSPRTPRSTAPLRSKGSGPSSSAERYDDENPPMRQTVSLEREHRRYSFSSFYVSSVLFTICLGICVAGVFVSQSRLDASTKSFLGDVEGLMLDSADAMCTSTAGSNDCAAQSAGKFVSTAETGTTDVLSGLVTFLEAIDDEVYPPLNATIDDLNLAAVDLNTIETLTDLINGNITLIQQYKDWLLASAPANQPTPLTNALPKRELPTVTAEQLAAVEDGRTAVATARTNAEEVYGTIQNFMATDVAQAVAEFNTSTPAGTTTQQLLEPLDQVFDVVLQGRDVALEYHVKANEEGERFTGYSTQKTWAVTFIFLLPFLFQVILTLLNRSCAKSSGHLVTNMCCNYFCLIFFIILAVIFSLLAVVSSTVCEYHLDLVAKVPPQNLTVNDVQISITPGVIEEILNCPASFPSSGATADDNFISILGAEGLFNISSQADEAIAQVEEARTSFSPEAQIQQAIDELANLGDSTAFNVSDGNEILSYRAEVLVLLADLPPVVMDRDNATQRASLTKYFITDPEFSWTDYQTSLAAVNALLVGATPIPPGFYPAYSFQTAWNFTRATVGAEPLWEEVVFRPPIAYDDLIDGLTQTDPFTLVVNEAVATNIEVQANLTAVLQALDDIQLSVNGIDAVQVNLGALQTQLNGTLYDLLAQAQGILTGLTAQEEGIRGLVAYVNTAPEYTKCGFVGEFYQEGFQENFCGDLHDSLSIMWPFMLAAATCLFLSFVTFSCFVRKPRWYRESDYDRREDRNNLTPGRTPRGAALSLA